MSEDVPERSPRHAPGFPVGVLDLVGLSLGTFRNLHNVSPSIDRRRPKPAL